MKQHRNRKKKSKEEEEEEPRVGASLSLLLQIVSLSPIRYLFSNPLLFSYLLYVVFYLSVSRSEIQIPFPFVLWFHLVFASGRSLNFASLWCRFGIQHLSLVRSSIRAILDPFSLFSMMLMLWIYQIGKNGAHLCEALQPPLCEEGDADPDGWAWCRR